MFFPVLCCNLLLWYYCNWLIFLYFVICYFGIVVLLCVAPLEFDFSACTNVVLWVMLNWLTVGVVLLLEMLFDDVILIDFVKVLFVIFSRFLYDWKWHIRTSCIRMYFVQLWFSQVPRLLLLNFSNCIRYRKENKPHGLTKR